MREAKVYMHDQLAGILSEIEKNRRYRFSYFNDYEGPAISLTWRRRKETMSLQVFLPSLTVYPSERVAKKDFRQPPARTYRWIAALQMLNAVGVTCL